jgi:DNA polymerase III gamma/tau subunit
VFVFATTDPHKLPATILSRVQRYDFKLVPTKRIVGHLEQILSVEKIAHDAASLMLVARESGGSVRDSLSLLDQVIASLPGEKLTEEAAAGVLGVADRSLLSKLGRAIVGKDPAAALALVDAAFTRGYDLPQLAQAFLGHLRDLVVVQAVKDPASLIEGSSGDLEELKSQAQSAPVGLPELLFDRFAKTAEDVSKSTVPRYVLEVGLVELTRVEPLEPLASLVGKLDALEARFEKGGARSGGGGGMNVAPQTTPPPRQAPPPLTATAPAPAPPTANVNVDVNASASTTGNRIAQLAEATQDVLLAGALHQARLLGWDAQKLSLGFESNFVADQVRDKLAELKTVLTTMGAGSPAVEIIVGPLPQNLANGAVELPGTETLIEVEQRKHDADRERRKQEALDHPARKLIDEKLGGTWKDPVVDLESDS